jgi:hypothetical protein
LADKQVDVERSDVGADFDRITGVVERACRRQGVALRLLEVLFARQSPDGLGSQYADLCEKESLPSTLLRLVLCSGKPFRPS